MLKPAKHRSGNKKSPVDITSGQVIEWFREAATKRRPKVPKERDVWLLVRTINELRRRPYSERELRIADPALPVARLADLDLLDDSEMKKVAGVQEHLRGLRSQLPHLVDVFDADQLVDPLVTHRLKQLQSALDALFEDAQYFFVPPKPGGQDRAWHIYVEVLRRAIEPVLKAVDRRPSVNPDGLLVTILVRALQVVCGWTYSRVTISTELKRARRRPDGFTARRTP